MKHHQYNKNYVFVKDPVDFNKYTDRSLLQYCLGATMYMPGTKDFAQAVIDKKEVIEAYVVKDGALNKFEMKLGELTDEERQIILKGCLINYNRV